MSLEFDPMDAALEQAVSEMSNESVDHAVVEAAAVRVWAKLAAEAERAAHPGDLRMSAPAPAIRGCADFRALMPDYRANRLPEARAMLLEDHLHECVACRRVYEGRVVTMPSARTPGRMSHSVLWGVAAVLVATTGMAVWFAEEQLGGGAGHAIVRGVSGTLYAVSADGIRPLAAGQDLPDGVEIRTAKDSEAMLELRDGSQVELRERSGFSSYRTGRDLTIHLDRGSIIVQAARRSSSHLYVATADCRVAVTGTVFSVSAGVKGSRVSVIQGEVHISQDNQEKVLHPGEQAVTSASLEPMPVREDISWSRNRDSLLKQLDALRSSVQQVRLPGPRYSSRLVGRLPASTVVFASIPNLAEYLGDVQSAFSKSLAQNPQLAGWWAGQGGHIAPMLEQLRAASEYLGDEITIVGFNTANGRMPGPVFFAEAKREGFAEFLKKARVPFSVESRNGLIAFSPSREALEAFGPVLDNASNGFEGTPFYARIAAAYGDGVGLMLSADLAKLSGNAAEARLPGVRYLVAEQKEVNHQMEARASLAFDGPRTGIAAWLAEPAAMGTLDYVSPDATFLTAFVVKSPGAILDQVALLAKPASNGPSEPNAQSDLVAGLGGEFALALDGPGITSWKLVTEVYDPKRVESGLEKLVQAYDGQAALHGGKPLRTEREVVDGRTYYTIAAGDPNPLLESHYTFAEGYLIAGPSRDAVTRALQLKRAGITIKRASRFIELAPRDHYDNFSAVIYQNLGTTLGPLVGMLGAFVPQGHGQANPLQGLANMKPSLLAAYGEPDRITVAASGDVLGMSLSRLLSGDVAGMLPLPQFLGTRQRQTAFR